MSSLKDNYARVTMRVAKPTEIVSFLTVLSLLLVISSLSESHQNITVGVSDSVQFPCSSDLRKIHIWEHDNDVLFNDKLKIDFQLDHVILLDNYTLLIPEVTLQHEGIYRCLQDKRIVAEFLLNVEVPPRMFFTINKLDHVTNISVAAGTDVTLFCLAVGALPPVNLSWTTNEENNDHRAPNFTIIVGGEYQRRQVFDSVSAHTFKLSHNNGTISCRSKTVSAVGNREINLQYSTFVLPDVRITVNNGINKSEVYIPLYQPSVATCYALGSRPASNLFWYIDTLPINHSDVANQTIVQKQDLFNTISSMFFTPQNTSGSITCISKFSNKGNHRKEKCLKFYTYMIPKMFISIEGIGDIDFITVAVNQLVQVVCNASAARPKSHISWLVNNQPIKNLEEVNETSFYVEKDDATFDTVSTMWYRPKDATGSITCTSQFGSMGDVARINATYLTYVIPKMYFTINGKTWKNVSTINVTASQNVTVICNAEGTRPKLWLLWKVNGRNFDTKSFFKINSGQTFNVTTFLEFLPNETETHVMCFTYGLNDQNIFILAYIQVTVTDIVFPATTQSYEEDNKSLKIFVTTLVLLLVTVPLVFVVIKSLARRSSHSMHEYQEHGNTDTNIAPNLSGKTPTKSVFEGLDLPEVPRGKEDSDYCPFSEDEYDSYFELKDKSSHHRMFRGKDMCLILRMNSGHLQSRWMGTISLPHYNKKCVVFSTVSDVTAKNDEIQWDTYVKRVLDMPNHKSLVKLEGVCVNQANLYLVHEHLTCDSLESTISSKRLANNRTGPFPTSDVASYLMEILEGMEVLHSFGFLHPGLSTKKVLLTDTGQCKLYSFFLAEDAPNKAKNMKSNKDCLINDLSPEALLRNEYTQASDVWCVAVVLWNLMTYDPIPVILENLEERKICNIQEEWPASHFLLKNHMLFGCWNYDEALRPSISELRSSFTKVLGNVQTFTSSKDFTESITDLYIPMGNIRATSL